MNCLQLGEREGIAGCNLTNWQTDWILLKHAPSSTLQGKRGSVCSCAKVVILSPVGGTVGGGQPLKWFSGRYFTNDWINHP